MIWSLMVYKPSRIRKEENQTLNGIENRQNQLPTDYRLADPMTPTTKILWQLWVNPCLTRILQLSMLTHSSLLKQTLSS